MILNGPDCNGSNVGPGSSLPTTIPLQTKENGISIKKKRKFDAKFTFLVLANFILKQVFDLLFAVNIVPSLAEGRNDIHGKQKLKKKSK